MVLLWVSSSGCLAAAEVTIKLFNKIGKIAEGFSEGEQSYFWHIDDICCDDKNNLYIADAGWSLIFKFDPDGSFLTTRLSFKLFSYCVSF
jgi:hypothetical protein